MVGLGATARPVPCLGGDKRLFDQPNDRRIQPANPPRATTSRTTTQPSALRRGLRRFGARHQRKERPLAERYERRSLIITSNLVFSEWNRIFKSPMTTAAAIDRLVHHAAIIEIVHHAAIIEIDRDSVRAEEAKKRNPTKTKNDDEDG